MSKRYEFHSKLSPEEIFVRLEERARYGNGVWISNSKQYIYHRNKDCFYLSWEGDIGIRGQFPFRGTVTETEQGSVIRGGFGLLEDRLRYYAILAGIVFLFSILFGMPFHMYPIVAVMILVWLCMCHIMAHVVNNTLLAKRRDRALEFIQQYLLE